MGALFICARVFGGGEEAPEYQSYVEDSLFGAIWRWSWVGNQVDGIWCFCPTCDGTLIYKELGGFYDPAAELATVFICENCAHKTVARLNGGRKDYALGAVKREIDRRVRTGEYRSL